MELEHVVVLAGGLSYEREVSLRSGRRVADALRALDIPVELRDADATLLDSLTYDAPDAVFPVPSAMLAARVFQPCARRMVPIVAALVAVPV